MIKNGDTVDKKNFLLEKITKHADYVEMKKGYKISTPGFILQGKPRTDFFGKVITSSKKYYVHDEKNKFKIGDEVKIIESKPFSKKKKWEAINN